MVIKHSIVFSVKNSSTAIGKELPIRMRICYHGHRVDVPIKIAVFPYNWDPNHQLVKGQFVNSKGLTSSDINSEILMYRKTAEDIFRQYEIQNTIPSEIMLKQSILSSVDSEVINCLKDDKQKGFWAVFDEFIVEEGKKKSWSVEQVRKFQSLRTDLKQFRENLSFNDLDEACLTDFVYFLRNCKKLHTPRKKKGGREKYDDEDITGIKNSTLEKKLEYLRWFLRWAMKKQYHSNSAFEEFRPTLKQTNNTVVYLTLDEIQKLKSSSLPKDKSYLEATRDFLLFACFTGLRYSDIKNLKKDDLHDEIIDVTTIKTADTLRIEYNDVSRQILNKYKDVPLPNNAALPVVSDQKLNIYLKELCKEVGFNSHIRRVSYKGNDRIEELKPKYELISTHTGRRSFICNCLAQGIPAEVVMKWTGHSDYKAMKPYIDVADEIKEREMKKMNLYSPKKK